MLVGLHTRLKPGAEDRYEEYHRAVWPEVVDAIRRAGITKYVIYRDGLDLFHHIECEDYDRATEEMGKDRPGMRWEGEIRRMMAARKTFTGRSSARRPRSGGL